MTAHVDEILLARRDEVHDEATDLYVTEHLSACAECRELEHKIDRADRLLARAEPSLPLPIRRRYVTQASATSGRLLRLGAVAMAIVLALLVGSGLRVAREPGPRASEAVPIGAAGPPGQATPSSAAIGGVLGGVALGMSGDQVRATLGEPDQTSQSGIQWIYGRGLVVYFKSGPLEDPDHVTSVLALPGSGARTGEGFSIGGLEADFRATYPAATEVTHRPAIYYVFDPLRRGVLTRAEFDGLGRATTLLVIEDDRPLVLPLRGLTVRRSQGTTDPVRLPAPEFREQTEAELRALAAQIGFTPLLPGRVPVDIEILLEDCGSARGTCIRLQWEENVEPIDETRILQGPAGCCVDAARPYGDPRPDIELRPDVFAEFIPLRPDEGGPLLWWTETTAPGSHVYVAISGPLLDRDELIEIARSMRPLD